MSSASETMSALPPNRRRAVAQWFVLLGAAIAIAVIVALIATWPHHTSAGASNPSPAAAKQADKSQSAAAALKP
jgi:hypothetical protein